MALVGTYEMLKMNTWHIKPVPLHLVVADPISTAGMTSRDLRRLTQQAENVIANLYYSRSAVPDLREQKQVSNESK
jgi:1-acyl-sn-glycerol-3-phosphate acyltransferase